MATYLRRSTATFSETICGMTPLFLLYFFIALDARAGDYFHVSYLVLLVLNGSKNVFTPSVWMSILVCSAAEGCL